MESVFIASLRDAVSPRPQILLVKYKNGVAPCSILNSVRNSLTVSVSLLYLNDHSLPGREKNINDPCAWLDVLFT